MAQTFDFKTLLARIAFDYIGPEFPAWWQKNKTRYNLPDLQAINKKQLLGSQYFMQIKLAYKGKEFILPNEPLVSISSVKTLIETPTVGKYKKGSVIEYITTENDSISIKGVCFDTENPDMYPAAQVSLLDEIWQINDSLDVVSSPFFELFGIRKVVIRKRDIPEMVGEQGLQAYTLDLISDQDFYADLNDLEVTQSNFLST